MNIDWILCELLMSEFHEKFWIWMRFYNQFWCEFSELNWALLLWFWFYLILFWSNLTSVSTSFLILWFIWDSYWFKRMIRSMKIFSLSYKPTQEFLLMLIGLASCSLISYSFWLIYFNLSHWFFFDFHWYFEAGRLTVPANLEECVAFTQ